MRNRLVRAIVMHGLRKFLVETNLAVAAIAAGSALLAEMIGAGVFGALHADAC